MRSFDDVFKDLLDARSRLYKEEEELINEQVGIAREKFNVLLGKYFKTKNAGTENAYYKVIGLPEPTTCMDGRVKFEPYLLTAIRIMQYDRDVPTKYMLPKISFMNVYCCRNGVEHISDTYEEITEEEFSGAIAKQICNINSYKKDMEG